MAKDLNGFNQEEFNNLLNATETNAPPTISVGNQAFELKPENTAALQAAMEAQRTADEARYTALQAQIEELKKVKPATTEVKPESKPALTVASPTKPAVTEELSPEDYQLQQYIGKTLSRMLGVDDFTSTMKAALQGTGMSIQAIQALHQRQEESQKAVQAQFARQERAQAAYAFASSTPEFEVTVDNMKAVDEYLDKLELKPTPDGYTAAYSLAVRAGKIKSKGGQGGGQGSGTGQASPPRLPSIGGNGNPGVGSELDPSVLERFAGLNSAQQEAMLKRMNIPLVSDFQ